MFASKSLKKSVLEKISQLTFLADGPRWQMKLPLFGNDDVNAVFPTGQDGNPPDSHIRSTMEEARGA